MPMFYEVSPICRFNAGIGRQVLVFYVEGGAYLVSCLDVSQDALYSSRSWTDFQHAYQDARKRQELIENLRLWIEDGRPPFRLVLNKQWQSLWREFHGRNFTMKELFAFVQEQFSLTYEEAVKEGESFLDYLHKNDLLKIEECELFNKWAESHSDELV